MNRGKLVGATMAAGGGITTSVNGYWQHKIAVSMNAEGEIEEAPDREASAAPSKEQIVKQLLNNHQESVQLSDHQVMIDKKEGRGGKGADLVIESSVVQLTRSSCADAGITKEEINAMNRAEALKCIYENPTKLSVFDEDDQNSIRNDPVAMEEFLKIHVGRFSDLGKKLKQDKTFLSGLYTSIDANNKAKLVIQMMGAGGLLGTRANQEERKSALEGVGVSPEDLSKWQRWSNGEQEPEAEACVIQ